MKSYLLELGRPDSGLPQCKRLHSLYASAYIAAMDKLPNPTLEDVARLANTSTATISRALNAPDKVAKPTRDRIEAAIEQLGYIPNFGARALAKNRVDTVGAIIPTLSNAMFANGIQAFQDRLSEAGVTLLIGTSAYDPEAEHRQIRNLVTHGAAGLLLIGTNRLDKTRAFLAKRRIPHVQSWCYDKDGAGVFVGFDNRASAYDATRAVLAQGHRHIAVISGISATNDRASERQEGIKAAIAQSPEARLETLIETPYLLQHGADAFTQIITRFPHVTAFICGNDVLAAGAMMGARDRGISIPRDISVIGFDDIGVASVVTPPLTTVRVPQVEMGHAAAAALLDLIAGKTPVPSLCLPTEFIARGSLGPVRR